MSWTTLQGRIVKIWRKKQRRRRRKSKYKSLRKIQPLFWNLPLMKKI